MSAGGFTPAQPIFQINKDPKNIKISKFKNGKVLRSIEPRVALHELARKEVARTIELNNIKILQFF